MLIRIGDSSQPLFPHQPPPPQPPQPQAAHVQPPMVYVYENPAWEYKVVASDAARDELIGEQELNELGARGWELAGVAAVAGTTWFYFKRVRK